MKLLHAFIWVISFWLASTPASLAQDAPEISMPVSSLSCLIEHQERYLAIPRGLLIFFADLCPAVSREEVAALVQNSAKDPTREPSQRLIMLKSDFQCLIQKITAYLDETDVTETEGIDAAEPAKISFLLDCD